MGFCKALCVALCGLTLGAGLGGWSSGDEGSLLKFLSVGENCFLSFFFFFFLKKFKIELFSVFQRRVDCAGIYKSVFTTVTKCSARGIQGPVISKISILRESPAPKSHIPYKFILHNNYWCPEVSYTQVVSFLQCG